MGGVTGRPSTVGAVAVLTWERVHESMREQREPKVPNRIMTTV